MGYPNTASRTLNPIQLMLLKLFNRDMSEQEINDIKTLIINYLDEKLQEQVEKDIQLKGITQADLDAILSDTNRTTRNESCH